MGEEVLSPTSPKIPYNTPGSRRKGSPSSMGQENNSLRSRRFSVQKPSKDNSRQKQDKSPNRARWPGLNVVTNFSKPPILAQRAADTELGRTAPTRTGTEDAQSQAMILPSRAYSGPKKRGQDPVGGNNNGVKAKNQAEADVKEVPGLGPHELNNVEERKPYSATSIKGPVNNLKRKSSRMTELSPSDRLIAIGIAVTPTSLDERTRSPELSREKLPNMAFHQYARDQAHPGAPFITVTPAKEAAPWSAVSDDRLAPYQPRPASSVYSQATNRGRAATQPSAIPPVPMLSDASLYQKPRNASEPLIRSDSSKPSARIISTCTVFEEDDSPSTGLRDRSDSGGPQLRILTRPSMDSVATRHRSQGWWNYIISPFSAKSNTPVLHVNEDDRDIIELDSPHSSNATMIGEELDEYTEEKKNGFSPPMRDSVQSDKTHTSIWTDGSYHEQKRGALNPTSQDTPRPKEDAANRLRAIGDADSPNMLLSSEGFGAAAEYYQACWHDQNSPTPYFECQNHTCLATPDSRPTDERTVVGAVEQSMELAPEASLEIPDDAQEHLKPTVFQQTPANRFSAAFKQAVTPETKPVSEETIIEDVDTTPEVEEARAAPVVRAPALVLAPQAPPAEPAAQSSKDLGEPTEPQAPFPRVRQQRAQASVEKPQATEDPVTEPAPPIVLEMPARRFVAVMPPDHPQPALQQPIAPEPIPPSARRGSAPQHNVAALPEMPLSNEQRSVYIVNHYHGDYPRPTPPEEQHTLSGLYPPPREESTTDENREKFQRKVVEQKEEKNKQKSKRVCCLKCHNCFSRRQPTNKKKKWLLIGIAIALILLTILILALAMTLTRKGDQMPVQTQWSNITGFPPIPTGISTIIDPDAAYEQSGCVSPTTMWSCALPKEDQASVAPNDPNQPNFRVEIRFQNGTNVSSGFNASLNRRSKDRVPNAVSASGLISRNFVRIRDSFSGSLFTPSPAPPSLEDQTFLGNTTDNVTTPFDGEVTPFFMSFESATKLPSRLLKRADGLRNSSDPNSTDPLPDLGSAIPPPDNNPDGTAAPANLLPFPSSQPLRLFDRGRPTEHYGFYTYFDRSIFLASTTVLNETTEVVGNVPGDENGGAEETAATVRCTWAQTRFLVQIWTNRGGTASLLTSSNSTATPSTNKHPQNLTTSSANDFNRPGSFPYPVSITLDRHGGDITKKEIFCYGLDNRQRIIPSQKKIQLEDRSFQGQLVNPALGPFGHVNVSLSDGGPGGIDGGNGGCGCVWRNWQGAT